MQIARGCGSALQGVAAAPISSTFAQAAAECAGSEAQYPGHQYMDPVKREGESISLEWNKILSELALSLQISRFLITVLWFLGTG